MKLLQLTLVGSVVFVLHFSRVSAGEVVGTVLLQGTPPSEVEITPLKNDPTCGKLHAEKVFTRFYAIGPNKELGDVVVMLKNVSGKSTGASAPPVVLDQKGCLYQPQILALQTQQKLVVKNSDPLLHNVHSTPKAPGNKEENRAQMAGGPDLTFQFAAPETFLRFKCDVHPWMFAWVTVVDSPYFAVTAKDGSFKIGNVPPGKYTVTALHRKAAPEGIDKEIEVTDGVPVKVDFTMEVKAGG